MGIMENRRIIKDIIVMKDLGMESLHKAKLGANTAGLVLEAVDVMGAHQEGFDGFGWKIPVLE